MATKDLSNWGAVVSCSIMKQHHRSRRSRRKGAVVEAVKLLKPPPPEEEVIPPTGHEHTSVSGYMQESLNHRIEVPRGVSARDAADFIRSLYSSAD